MPSLAGRPDAPTTAFDSDPSLPEVVELQLLLPRWQAEALEAAARDRGLTTGHILRRVIADIVPVGAR